MSQIEISYRNIHSLHGEELVHSFDPYYRPRKALTWPDTQATISGVREREPIVIKVDGLVVGRAYLETELYPFAEIENLIILPEFRGKGLGISIVEDMLKRAGELGYFAIHLQTETDNRIAQRLYQRCGFVPAQIGPKMLRMVRFLHYQLLSAFQAEFPLVLFSSEPTVLGERACRTLRWCDPITDSAVALTLSGGSCQQDSAGCGPGITRVEYRKEETNLRCDLTCRKGNARHDEVLLHVSISNQGSAPNAGCCRLLLNHGYYPVTETDGATNYDLAPGETTRVEFAVRQTGTFHSEFWKHACYRSIPFGVEVFTAGKVFWLAAQLVP